MDTQSERMGPSLADLVRMFLVEQFPKLSIILTNKCETMRYHPIGGNNIGGLSIYVDGVHVGWIEDGQRYFNSDVGDWTLSEDTFTLSENPNDAKVDAKVDREFVHVLQPADPEFFPKMLRLVNLDLERFNDDRWSVSGKPLFIGDDDEKEVIT